MVIDSDHKFLTRFGYNPNCELMQKAKHSRSDLLFTIFGLRNKVSITAMFSVRGTEEPKRDYQALARITAKHQKGNTNCKTETVIISESSNSKRATNFKIMKYCSNGTNN